MLNVMIISPTSGLAGPDICIENLTKGMDKNKYRPVVIVPPGAMLSDRLKNEGIAVYELTIHWWFAVGINSNGLIERFINIKQRIEPLLDIVRFESIDLIVTNTTVTLDGAILASESNLPHLFIAHALFEKNIYPNLGEKTRTYAYRLFGKLSYNVVCCCDHLRDSYSHYISNAICVNNGVDTERFGFLQRRITPIGYKLDMLCAGHYNANKQQDFIIKALYILKRQRPDLINSVHLTCMGEGEVDYKTSLAKLIKKMDLESTVFLDTHHIDINNQYYRFNLYVNSSVTENLPLSVIEAMSTGMPVIGTRNKGIIALVEEGKTGYICDTPYDMAQRIIELLEQPELIEQMSIASRERICCSFTIEQYVEGIQSAFDNATSDTNNKSESSIIMRDLYRALSDSPSKEFVKKLSILIIYSKQAVASYAIAIKEPLEYIKHNNLFNFTYEAMDIGDLSVNDINDYDIIFCVRFFHEAAHQLALKARELGKVFIWYIDDNYSRKALIKPTKELLANSMLYDKMFISSSAVIVNNPKLYKYGKELGANIELLPTYQIITDEEMPFIQKNKKIRFGFFGTLNRDNDFDCITPAILRILTETNGNVEVEFIGYVPPQLTKMPSVKTYPFIFDYRQFRSFFASRGWDFALAPLKDTVFNQSKTNNKYREYSSFSVPGIYSKVEPYLSCINNEVNGLLSENTSQDWYNAITRMMNDSKLRNRIRINAYDDIKNNYNIKQYASKMIEFLVLEYSRSLQSRSFSLITTYPGNTYETPQRSVPQHYLCTSRNIRNHRCYWITLRSPVVHGLKMFFTSYSGQCAGVISIGLFIRNKNVAKSKPINMNDIIYNAWTEFEFVEPIKEYDMATLELRFIVKYDSKNRICVYEDQRKRTFFYKLFNKLHLDGLQRNVILIEEM